MINVLDTTVVPNGQYSSWTNNKAGVSQGSILDTLFFLNYVLVTFLTC